MPRFVLGMPGLLSSVLLVVGAAGAEPMDLRDPRPRWVDVELEISPRDEPGSLDAAYTPKLPAWLQPAARPGWVVVAVPGESVERHLVGGERPKPGSFSELVWLFDARTGHVLAATLTGILYRRLDWGLFAVDTEARIRVEAGTERAAGFRKARRLLGQLLHDYCEPGDSGGCTRVEPVPYDPRTGYVNAVGQIIAGTKGIRTRLFSAIGEARFSERDEGPVPSALADRRPR